jgi:hypothetical protein
MNRYLLCAVLGTLGLFATCQTTTRPVPTPAESLQSPPADYIGVAWLAGGELVVAWGSPHEPNAVLAFVDRETSEVVDLPVAPDQNCMRELLLSPQALPDGRVGFLHVCQHAINGVPPDDTDLWALDVATGDIEVLMAIGPLGTSKGVPYATSPDLSIAVVGVGSICSYLIVNRADGSADRLTAEISDDGRTFSLADEIPLAGDCPMNGRAFQPTLSADGLRLAFLASPASVGVAGRGRLDMPSNLYVLTLATNEVQEVVADVQDAGDLQWSPANDELAFSGRVGSDPNATWVVDLDGQRRAVGPVTRGLAWSPDGTQLFASFLASTQEEPFRSTLGILEVH